MIRYRKDTDNIVTLSLDMEGRKVNIINHEIGQAFIPVIQHLKEEKAKGQLRGVILTSEKKTFLAGGDLDYLYNNVSAKEIFGYSEKLKAFFRDLESPGIPVVAAINGTALGSGFELPFACHYRIAIDRKDSYLGFPEVRLGLMPGSGGIIRLLWLLGIEKAYDILTKGKRYSPREALNEGLIHELAEDRQDMIAKAKKWLLENPKGIQPWDTPTCSIPGGSANELATAKRIAGLIARHIKTYRNKYPAPHAILDTLVEGSKLDFDTACRVESRNFTELVVSRESKNMTKVFWYDYNAIRNGENRPKGFGKFRPRKVGVIGAGQMGSGISFACASNGIDVILKDVSEAVAIRGKAAMKERLGKKVEDHLLSTVDMENILDRIQPTQDNSLFETCDLVVEAVFENEQIKKKVTKDAGKHMDEYSFFASNTAMISIGTLSESYPHPENYLGLRFFAPVETQPLVEIVRGPKTSDETVARGFDFIKRIKKTPIIVKDNPGFYAARVRNVFLLEGILMLKEGYPAPIIENACMTAGMPEGALQKADEISLKVVLRAERQAAEIYGQKYVIHPAADVVQKMVDEERSGKFAGKGFYDYEEGKRTGLWEGLKEFFPVSQTEFDMDYLIERILFAQTLEAIWCYQEGIVGSVPEANIGSVFGWGFPAFHGGVLQYVDDYGVEPFIAKAKEFQDAHGPRFIVPKLLRKMAEEGKNFSK